MRVCVCVCVWGAGSGHRWHRFADILRSSLLLPGRHQITHTDLIVHMPSLCCRCCSVSQCCKPDPPERYQQPMQQQQKTAYTRPSQPSWLERNGASFRSFCYLLHSLILLCTFFLIGFVSFVWLRYAYASTTRTTRAWKLFMFICPTTVAVVYCYTLHPLPFWLRAR